jgi:histidinol-phosphate aminotransferase
MTRHGSVIPPTQHARRVSRREFGRSTVAATIGASFLPSAAVGLAQAGALAHTTPAIATAGVVGATIRISANENPYGLGPAALAALQAGEREANRYPGASIGSLTSRLCAMHGVGSDRLLLTPGSGEILRAATRAFTSSSKALVTAAPTFEAPERAARGVNAPIQAVPVQASGSLDLTAMAARATGAGMFFICNPNNPTGGVNSIASLTAFVAAVRKSAPDAVILIDEAYYEYVDDPSYATAIPLTQQDPKILVSRTFSKIHGMAGLRVGFAIGNADLLAAMRPHLSQGTIGGPSASAALASLDDRDHLAKQCALNRDARAFTIKTFESAGFHVLSSQANFVMVDVRRDAASFQAQCREAGVQIARAFPPLTTHARITIGTLDEMKRATALMLPLLAAPASAFHRAQPTAYESDRTAGSHDWAAECC